jgi:predicted DNA-binding transcriptional regulator
MSIVRTMKRENPFVQLDKEFIGNGRLSLKATGLLTYILSKPDGWQIRMRDIQNRFNDGETSVRSAMNELVKQGYVNRYRDRSESGTFGDYIYEVYERPEFNPKRENHVLVDSPKRDFPELDNPELDNQVYSNNDFSNKDFSNKKEEEEEGFQQLSELMNLFKNCIGTVNRVVENKLSEWLLILPFEIIKAEIENGALYGAKSWFYIEKSLQDDRERNIRTLADLNNKVTSHKSSKAAKQSTKVKKITRTEIVPKWFEQDQRKEETKVVNADDLSIKKQSLEERLKKYKKN